MLLLSNMVKVGEGGRQSRFGGHMELDFGRGFIWARNYMLSTFVLRFGREKMCAFGLMFGA
jgi:hypothetical protein